MNPTSSRSHAIFTIYLEIELSEANVRESVINLVDLAGSESIRKTGNTGEAQVEGKNINESLSAFTRVIIAMSRREKHIPFRDSVVTNILRDSLKPDCYLTLLGCVSPYQSDSGQTSSTLGFVAEAKSIKRTPQLNPTVDEFQVNFLVILRCNYPYMNHSHSIQISKRRMTSTPKPNSSTRFATPLRQLSSLAAIPNKSLSVSRAVSEPRSRTIIGNLSATKRFGKKSVSDSISKRLRLSDHQNMGSSFAINRYEFDSMSEILREVLKKFIFLTEPRW